MLLAGVVNGITENAWLSFATEPGSTLCSTIRIDTASYNAPLQP